MSGLYPLNQVYCMHLWFWLSFVGSPTFKQSVKCTLPLYCCQPHHCHATGGTVGSRRYAGDHKQSAGPSACPTATTVKSIFMLSLPLSGVSCGLKPKTSFLTSEFQQVSHWLTLIFTAHAMCISMHSVQKLPLTS